MDHQYNQFNRIRGTLSLVAAPLQYSVDSPVGFIRWIETSFSTQQDLLVENAQLRARQLLLYAKLQKVLALEQENEQLKALLRSSTNIHEKVTVAQLLAVDMAPFTQQIVIDKGEKGGVYVGQPVLDAYGVMGQIMAVGPINSRVLLVTDTRSAIPVQNNRNGNRAVASGLGIDGVLELINVPITADFKKGDFLVTSGLGGHYPPGYPVGVINNVKLSKGERFLNITISPSAHVNQSRQVLLVWPKKSSFDHLPPINSVSPLYNITPAQTTASQGQASIPVLTTTGPNAQVNPATPQNNTQPGLQSQNPPLQNNTNNTNATGQTATTPDNNQAQTNADSPKQNDRPKKRRRFRRYYGQPSPWNEGYGYGRRFQGGMGRPDMGME